MALPHWLDRLNLRFSNLFMRPIASRLPSADAGDSARGRLRRDARGALSGQPRERWRVAIRSRISAVCRAARTRATST
ncbi:MAG: hypothetical protein ACXWMB_05445, partial [Candidatus Limnocylindria bacterium]